MYSKDQIPFGVFIVTNIVEVAPGATTPWLNVGITVVGFAIEDQSNPQC